MKPIYFILIFFFYLLTKKEKTGKQNPISDNSKDYVKNPFLKDEKLPDSIIKQIATENGVPEIEIIRDWQKPKRHKRHIGVVKSENPYIFQPKNNSRNKQLSKPSKTKNKQRK
jgi:hypothetical protein